MSYLSLLRSYRPEPTETQDGWSVWETLRFPTTELASKVRLEMLFNEDLTAHVSSGLGDIYYGDEDKDGTMVATKTKDSYNVVVSALPNVFKPVYWQDSLGRVTHAYMFKTSFNERYNDMYPGNANIRAMLSEIVSKHKQLENAFYETFGAGVCDEVWKNCGTDNPLLPAISQDRTGYYNFGDRPDDYYVSATHGHYIFNMQTGDLLMIIDTVTAMDNKDKILDGLVCRNFDAFVETIQAVHQSQAIPVSQTNYKQVLGANPLFAPEIAWWDAIYSHLGY